jgi:hypothetical protein
MNGIAIIATARATKSLTKLVRLRMFSPKGVRVDSGP